MKNAALITLAIVLANPTNAQAEPSGQGEARDGADLGYGPDVADQLGEMAVAANPSVQAIADRVAALEQEVRRAGAWMDPSVSAEYSNMPIDDPVPGQHPMSGVQLMLRQTFYWPGKIAARTQEAESRIRQEQAGLAEQRVQLRASVKRAYYRLALARQLRDVTRENVRLASGFIDVVRVRVEAGLAAQHELLRLRVLVGRLQDDLGSFDRDEAALTAVINATLHRALDVPVPTPERTPLVTPRADATTLARQAEAQRPLLKRLSAEHDTYLASARRAQREGYPDITLWAGYRVRTRAGADPGRDFASVGVSVPLPLSYDARARSERRHDEQLATAALHNRDAALDGIRGELGRVVADWRRAVQQAKTYHDELIPEARTSLEAAFASYRVGRADFASLFQAEVDLLGFERTARMAEATAAQASVDVEALIGAEERR